METKWFYISIAIVFSSIALSCALSDAVNKPKTKYEAFNAAVKDCRSAYFDSGKQQTCMEIVERAYNLSIDDEKIQNKPE